MQGVKKVFTGVIVLVMVFLIFGCSLSNNVKYKSVKDENRRTEFLFNNYKINYDTAKGYEDNIKNGLIKGKIEDFDLLNTVVSDMHDEIMLNIDKYNSIEDLSDIVRDLDIGTVISSAEVYYFFDDENSMLEQYFVIKVPSNYIYKLSLLWLKGECIEVNKDMYH